MRLVCGLALALQTSCGHDAEPKSTPPSTALGWQVVIDAAPGALLRVAGTGHDEVLVVGADAAGEGPLVYRLANGAIERLDTGVRGSLWWWHQTDDDTIQMVGDQGLVLSYQASSGTFARLDTPITQRLFGVWSASAEDVWYVGGDLDQGIGTILHGDGTRILASDMPAQAAGLGAMFKVTGFGRDAVFMVGQRGRMLHCDGQRFESAEPPSTLPLLSISGSSAEDLYVVGGGAQGVILHRENGRWTNETPRGLPLMNSVWARADGEAYAAGFNGHLYVREGGAWHEFSPAPPTFQDLHSVWVDAEGGIWLAGGRLSVDPPTDGVLLYYGRRRWEQER